MALIQHLPELLQAGRAEVVLERGRATERLVVERGLDALSAAPAPTRPA